MRSPRRGSHGGQCSVNVINLAAVDDRGPNQDPKTSLQDWPMHVVRDVEQLRKEDLVDKMRARPVSPRDMGENMSGRATTWSGMAHPFVKLSRIGGGAQILELCGRAEAFAVLTSTATEAPCQTAAPLSQRLSSYPPAGRVATQRSWGRREATRNWRGVALPEANLHAIDPTIFAQRSLNDSERRCPSCRLRWNSFATSATKAWYKKSVLCSQIS